MLSPAQAYAHVKAARSILEECIEASVERTGSDGDTVRALLAVVDHERAYRLAIGRAFDGLGAEAARAAKAAMKPARWGVQHIENHGWLAYPDAETGADWPWTCRSREAALQQIQSTEPRASEWWQAAEMPDDIFFPLRDLGLAQARLIRQKQEAR
ncbi:hypothetical protein CCAX7_14760 [Capsulimonas corticalis]|uniref:Uncharacterized protein n=2 Tax=Capsulimonas corticalis TaxID=2219043 RepID=A0A9N7QBP1_9BACT|nr:hypothetical protein CCAX7_14760 [Capsulimonas corticalis]